MPKEILRLGRFEAEKGNLPALCMRCGAPATERVSKKFAWHAQWVYALILLGLIPMLIVGLIMTKRMRVDAPFCNKHKNHWTMRGWVLAGGFLGIVVLGLAGIVRAGTLPPNQADDFRGMVFGGAVILGLCWLVMAIILDSTAIKVKEITDHSITLSGVNSDFCAAVTQSHMADPTYDPRITDAPPKSKGTDQYYTRDN